MGQPNLYRLVKVKSVKESAKSFCVSFENSHVLISMKKTSLREQYGINMIQEGEEFFIKGNVGNSDVELASPNCLADIRRG